MGVDSQVADFVFTESENIGKYTGESAIACDPVYSSVFGVGQPGTVIDFS